MLNSCLDAGAWSYQLYESRKGRRQFSKTVCAMVRCSHALLLLCFVMLQKRHVLKNVVVVCVFVGLYFVWYFKIL